MKSFSFHMPTRIIFGRGIFDSHREEWKAYGKKAMIITGSGSAKACGALDKVTGICEESGQQWLISDAVKPNPHSGDIDSAAAKARSSGADFLVAIGGGSPMDTAKVASILVKHPEKKAADFCKEIGDDGIPVICVPTTAGTGSEATPFAVITVDELGGEKKNTMVKIYPKASWLEPAFTDSLPMRVRRDTAVDALCQLAEGYLTTRSQPMTDAYALEGLRNLGGCMTAILSDEITSETSERLMYAACLSGMVISQTGISLPHIMGYSITDRYDLTHGHACGLLLTGYLRAHPDESRISSVLKAIGMSSIDELGAWLGAVLNGSVIVEEDAVDAFTRDVMTQTARLESFPLPVGGALVQKLYYGALNRG